MLRGNAALMMHDPHILLFGGSYEAQLLAQALTARGVAYTMWLFEAPRGPASLPQVPHLRRFKDAMEMKAEIAQSGFSAVLDASHAFDQVTTAQAYAAAQLLGLPYLRVERAAWDLSGHKRWNAAPNVPKATAMIAKGARVFCATGWDSLPDYAEFCGEVLMLRQTRKHSRTAPYSFVDLVFGDPPFDVESEVALFSELRVDLLICRNLGGEGSRPKLQAAETLGIDAIVIDRPETPSGIEIVHQIEAAIAWVDAL